MNNWEWGQNKSGKLGIMNFQHKKLTFSCDVCGIVLKIW